MATSTLQKGVDLLWTNPNLGVPFSGQAINVPSMTPYSFILIEYRVFYLGTNYCQSLLRRATSLAKFEMDMINGAIVGRSATLTNNTTITFSDGRAYNTYGTATTYNDGMVPYRVLGIK